MEKFNITGHRSLVHITVYFAMKAIKAVKFVLLNKYLPFLQLSKEIPGLISFRKDWLDLLAVQRTLKSLLQRHSSKASILQ